MRRVLLVTFLLFLSAEAGLSGVKQAQMMAFERSNRPTSRQSIVDQIPGLLDQLKLIQLNHATGTGVRTTPREAQQQCVDLTTEDGSMNDDVPEGCSCGINRECNNLNLLRINLGVYIFFIEVWSAFIPTVVGFDDILCFQDIFPVIAFGLVTIANAWLDLAGAAPHTKLQLGGIYTNLTILGISILLGMAVTHGKTQWVGDHFEAFYGKVTEAHGELEAARNRAIHHFVGDYVEPDSRPVVPTEAQTQTEDPTIKTSQILREMSLHAATFEDSKLDMITVSQAPRLMMIVYLVAVVVPVVAAFAFTDGWALHSGFKQEDGGYSYGSSSTNFLPGGLLIGFLVVHWVLMFIWTHNLIKRFGRIIEHNHLSTTRIKTVARWVLAALAVSHIAMFLCITPWGSGLPMLNSGTKTIGLGIIGLLVMLFLILAAVVARNGTDFKVSFTTFMQCKTSKAIETARIRTRKQKSATELE